MVAAPSTRVAALLLLLCSSARAEAEVHKPDPKLKLLSDTISPVVKPFMENEAPLQEQLTRALGGFLNMAPSAAEVSAEIEETINDEPIVLYSYTLSPFSQEAVKVLESTHCMFHTVDLGPQWMLLGPRSSAIRAELGRLYGVTSIPQVFIGGEWVGGLFSGGTHGGGLNQLIEEKRLMTKIAAAGGVCMGDMSDEETAPSGPSWEIPIEDIGKPAAPSESGIPVDRHVEVIRVVAAKSNFGFRAHSFPAFFSPFATQGSHFPFRPWVTRPSLLSLLVGER